MRNSQKVMSIWAVVFVIGFIFFQYYQGQEQTRIREFGYNTFIKALESGEVEKVSFNQSSNTITGTIKADFKEKYKGANTFKISGNTGDAGFELVRKYGLTPNYEAEDGFNLFSILGNMLPLILVFVVFMFLIRQLQAGGGKAMSFGKSRAKMLTENKKRVNFNDVAGVEEAKQDLEEIVE